MMQRVLHVIPSLRPGGAVRQLGLLTEALPRDRFECRVLAFAADGLEAFPDGVERAMLDWRRAIDWRPLWKLRKCINDFKPSVIHAWHPTALAAVRVAGLRGARLVVSQSFTSHSVGLRAEFANWLLRG